MEEHAYHTYDTFLKEHEAELRATPAPQVAIDYYCNGDLYLFDQFPSAHQVPNRRPEINNLYDVFVAIRDDELEHVKTMESCAKSDAPEQGN